MARFFGYLLLAGIAIYIIQLALMVGVIFLIVAGLIFRTKQTISILAVLGLVAAVSHFPVPTTIAVGAFGLLGLILNAIEKRKRRTLPAPANDI